MNDEKLFVGLITHRNSKYLNEDKKHSEFEKLITSLIPLKVISKISDKDFFEFADIDRFKFNFFQSQFILLFSLLKTEYMIIKYSYGKGLFQNLFNIFLGIGLLVKLNIKIMLSIFSKASFLKNHILRHENISQSHQQLMKESIETGAQFTLILEDDFQVGHEYRVKAIVSELMDFLSFNDDVMVVDVSKSFSEEELGKKYIKTESVKLNLKENLKIQNYKYPVTNTVCATLYRNQKLKLIQKELSLYTGMFMVPIDIRINLVLQKLAKKNLLSKDCYASLIPGVFIQRSLHGE